LGLFPGSREAVQAVSDILFAGVTPRCIEFLDEGTLGALRTAGSAIPESAKALLILEVDGDEPACELAAARIGDAVESTASSLLVARDGAQREKLWSARREMSPAVRKMARSKLSEDIVVPRKRLVELFDAVARESERSGVRTVSYGHAGDGNIHVNFLWEHEDERPKVEESIEALFRTVVALGGTLSGEHGIGILKAPYLSIEQSEELILLQRDLKRVFDPEGLLNPGKIFPGGHRAC
jgi:glycolate oxidase